MQRALMFRKLLIPRKVLETKLAIYQVNLVNSQFYSYTMDKHFCPLKVQKQFFFVNFSDSAWELSMLTTLIVTLHMDSTFTWHLGT